MPSPTATGRRWASDSAHSFFCVRDCRFGRKGTITTLTGVKTLLPFKPRLFAKSDSCRDLGDFSDPKAEGVF